MNDYSLSWDDGTLVAVDQRELPHRMQLLQITTVDELIDAVRTLAIRGAPVIGIAGAFGVALAARAHINADGIDVRQVILDAERIAAARPTAVNLAGGVRRALAKLTVGCGAVLDEALGMLAEDARVNRAAADHAADLLVRVCPDRALRVLTHCNTGRLATAAVGTALGAIRALASRGKIHSVLVDETRPLLQGARLTTWELAEASIPHRLVVDSAAAWAMASGEVDCVVVGADRIAANGDVANKIGTYQLALAADRHRIPFVVVAPESTRDPDIASGREIVVEERPANEVTGFGGIATAPPGTVAFNPAFDVTPAELITAIVTEHGVLFSEPVELTQRILACTTLYPDFPKPGITFRDLAGLYADPDLLAESVSTIAREFATTATRVLAVEARGFVLGAALATELGAPLILARKSGKLPGETCQARYDLEYGSGALHIQKGSIPAGEQVLVVDDVLATGGTLTAAIELVRAQGADVTGVAVLMSLVGLGGRDRLAGHRLVSLTEVAA